jgi:prepilin-type N-terminal cleavage/methylation domain-containing protein
MTRSRAREAEEAGFTLVELVVTVALFTMFMSLFIGVVISLYRGSTWVQSTSESSSGVLVTFQSLDRQIRYADSVNFPGVGASGARYIEFRTPATSLATVDQCTQWRLTSDGRLQSRKWNIGSLSSVSSWSTKMRNVIQHADPQYPFSLIKAQTSASAKQQLVLTIEGGSEAEESGSRTSTTFVARNSSIASPSNIDTIVPGVSNTPVCTIPGWEMRP